MKVNIIIKKKWLEDIEVLVDLNFLSTQFEILLTGKYVNYVIYFKNYGNKVTIQFY